MACIPKTPSKSLSPALQKVKPGRDQFEQFKVRLSGLVDQINSSPNESEEHHKNHISDFLKHVFKFPAYFINTNDRIDLVIHNGKSATDSVGVIIEVKRPSNHAEMPTKDNINVKAMQELVLYYLRERITANNLAVKTSYGRINTFAIFTEKATQLLAAKAVCTLIIPDSICNIDYYMKLRKFLLDGYTLHEIVELGDGVFDEAVVPAIIFSFSNICASNNIIKIGHKSSSVDNNKYEIPQLYYYKTPKFSFNLHVDELFVKVQSLLETGGASLLKDVADIKIGICTGGNSKHLSNSPVFSNSKKVLQGRDINRYALQYNNLYVNYDRAELLRARDEAIFISEEKLLMRQTSDKLILTYDDKQHYTIDSLFIIHSDKIKLKYLLALLNSKLLNRQYQKLNPEQGRVFAQVKIDYVNELPIVVNEGYIDIMVGLVDKILALKNQNSRADTSVLENEIDQLVYELYDLTPEEIALVEGDKGQGLPVPPIAETEVAE
jgi:hypothetical protein